MRGIRKQNIKIALFFDVYVKKMVLEHLGRVKIHFRLHMDSSVDSTVIKYRLGDQFEIF